MNPPRPVLVLLAHPALHRSRVNRPLAEAARDVDGVTLVDLYARFPDFQVDVAEQQELLLRHEVIVLQHPMFWYSCPALLKEWLDLVLQYGFAYGPRGTALAGKALCSAITTGGAAEAYRRGGHNRFEIAELLRPFEQTARFCGMRWLPPHVVHGTHALGPTELEAAAAEWRECLASLADPALDLIAFEGDRLRPLARGNGAGPGRRP